MDPVDSLVSLRPEMTKLLLADRALVEMGAKAFVSYVRAYKEHHCKYIFQFDHLELGELASRCLSPLAAMPSSTSPAQPCLPCSALPVMPSSTSPD